MTKKTPQEPSAPENLPEALHDLKNCLSVVRSGCLLMEDALSRGATAEIQPLIDAVRNSTTKALGITRLVPDLANAAPQDGEER